MRVVLVLTDTEGHTVWVSPAHVRSVRAEGKGARVEFSDGEAMKVRQQPEDIAKWIDRWLSAAYLGER